ncbi:MAG: DUF1559 domain-containing protein [Planctomycetes bacterium]|nr:DUF1559 domain-containing protein [Planctomycetota bacterium]
MGSCTQFNRPRPGFGAPPDLACPAGPYDYQSGDLVNHCDVFHFWSLHPAGSNFLFVDNSVRFFTYQNNNVLPALATRNGGEPTSTPE